MAATNQFIREALQGTSESFDIYGSVNHGGASSVFSDAINDQLRQIAEQEEQFKLLRATRTNTPFTDHVEQLVKTEKQRVLETYPEIVHPQATPAQ